MAVCTRLSFYENIVTHYILGIIGERSLFHNTPVIVTFTCQLRPGRSHLGYCVFAEDSVFAITAINRIIRVISDVL